VKKILLADDSITIQKVVELTFSEGDYQVICVGNGTQALRKVAEARPDVVLLDVIMPEKNGYEVCEQIKRSPATAGIPVLLLTGTFEPFDRKRADSAGADGHLTKPFESQALVTKVEELIARTPAVVSEEAAGGMEVIAGGDIYKVEAGRESEGLRPAPQAQGRMPLAPPPAPAPEAPAAGSHPSLAPPDAAAGGSYVGFADLGVGSEDEAEIVPDRFEESPGSPATVKVGRDALLGGLQPPGAAGGGEEEIAFPTEPIEGLTGGYEIPSPSSPSEAATPESDWTPPPEAPPAETWQDAGEESTAPPVRDELGGPFAPPAPAPATPASSPAPTASLTAEAIDLIAERVVERLSDRVVREIAWEVIPQVAEAVVRRRIKEIEDGEG
jgi:CheY-like chemotaxis protein